MTQLITPGQSLFAQLKINLDEISIEQAANYTAVEYFLLVEDEPLTNATNIEKVRRYLEAFFHLCNAEDWLRASYILFSNLDIFNNQPLNNQLHSWGYHIERIDLCNAILNKFNDQIDAICLRNIGNSYMILGQHNQAIKLYKQSLVLAQKNGDKKNEWATLRILSNFYFSREEYHKSIGFCSQFLLLSQKIQNKQGEGEALTILATAHYMLGESHKATELFQQCIEYVQALDEQPNKVTVLTTLGNVYSLIQAYDNAIECYLLSLQIAEAIGYQQIGGVWQNLGNTLIKLERYSEALEAFSTALEKSRKNGVRVGEAHSLFKLAELHQKLGNRPLALEYCNEALEIATNLDIPLVKDCQEFKRGINAIL